MIYNLADGIGKETAEGIVLQRGYDAYAKQFVIPRDCIDSPRECKATTVEVFTDVENERLICRRDSTEYGDILTDNFGLDGEVVCDIITVEGGIFIEVVSGVLYFRSVVDKKVYAINEKGDVVEVGEKSGVYWKDDVNEWVEKGLGELVRYRANIKESSVDRYVNNTIFISRMRVWTSKTKNDTFTYKMADVNTGIGLGKFEFKLYPYGNPPEFVEDDFLEDDGEGYDDEWYDEGVGDDEATDDDEAVDGADSDDEMDERGTDEALWEGGYYADDGIDEGE